MALIPPELIETLQALVKRLDGLPECVTQDPREPAGPEFLRICATWGTEIADSVHCPPECGGHPICKPCLALALDQGLVR